MADCAVFAARRGAVLLSKCSAQSSAVSSEAAHVRGGRGSLAPTAKRELQKRGITLEEAAEYTGLSPSGYRDWVRKGLLPGPWPGTRRYDRKAIDVALDRLSGLSTSSTGASAYDDWKMKHAAISPP